MINIIIDAVKAKISVVIPTYNNFKGLNYLINYFKDKPYQVIVVDNNISVKKLTGRRINGLNKMQNVKIKMQNDNEKCKMNKENILDLDGITAACLLIKTKVFKDLGNFDERFFAYLEDVDFF